MIMSPHHYKIGLSHKLSSHGNFLTMDKQLKWLLNYSPFFTALPMKNVSLHMHTYICTYLIVN